MKWMKKVVKKRKLWRREYTTISDDEEYGDLPSCMLDPWQGGNSLGYSWTVSPWSMYSLTRNYLQTSGSPNIYLHSTAMLEKFLASRKVTWGAMVPCGTSQMVLPRSYPFTSIYSANGTRFTVQQENGNNSLFKPSRKGLFFSVVECDIVLVNKVYGIKNK